MNAAADRLDDSFPHGTQLGYQAGCRGNICPAGDEYGLSCKRAHQLHAGDYRYQKLVKRGLAPADIALELGLIPDNPTTDVVPAKNKPQPPAPTDAAQPLAERSQDPSDNTPAPADEVAAATPQETPAEGEDMGHLIPVAEPKPAIPSQSIIRAWARDNGIDVNPRGPVRTDVVDAYLAAHATPTPSPVTDADLDAWAEDHPEPTPIPNITDQIDQLRPRIDIPTPEPLTIDENALAGAAEVDPDEGVEVATPAEFAARWNGMPEEERAAWVEAMRLASATAARCRIENHADLVRLRDTRPDWATVATTEDLGHAIAQRDQARRFAENTLAELTHLEAREESALTLALQKWAEATTERDTLTHEVTTLRNTLYAVRDVEAQLSAAYAEIRALADAAAERDRLAARLALSDAHLTSQQHEIERQRRVIEAAAASRPTIMRDVLRIGRAR